MSKNIDSTRNTVVKSTRFLKLNELHIYFSALCNVVISIYHRALELYRHILNLMKSSK